jgi:hypothetical protein
LACFKDGFSNSGSFLDVGGHRFYVAKPFPEEVTDVLDPLYDTGSDCSESSDLCAMVEVLAREEDGGSDPPRTARPPLKRPPLREQDLPPPERDMLDAAITDLRAPLDLTADPAKLSEDLERTRRNLLKEAIGVEDTCWRVLSMLHEYNSAQGYIPVGDGPSRAGQVRQRGRELGAELNQAAPSAKLPPVIAKPTYRTPTKNLHATRYITSELAGLQGEDLWEKQAWLQELLDTADLQQQAMEPNGDASGTWHDNRIVVAGQNKSQAQASSPNHGPVEHSRSNRAPGKSGGNHRTHHSGNHSRQPRDPAAVTSKPCNPPRPDAAEPARGKSAAQAAPALGASQGAQGHQPTHSHVSLRIGDRVDPPKDDARHRLNQLADSKFDEEESSAGPVCFGPCICNEPFLAKFTLPRDMPKYTEVVKPEDWLSDYVTAVDIAGGNKRTAVRYAPLMLTWSAWTWLNSLPALQINSWHDFQEAFIKNFTRTYKRPPRPRQLALCKQGPDEPDRDYLTRWSELCNSCEGVGEEQAIGYFMDGCREGTLLKHKLHRAELKTMADFMAIADKYASAAFAARVQYIELAPAGGQSQPASGQGGHHNHDHHSKRKDERHDNKYGSKQVAAVQGIPGATGGSQKRKGDKFSKDKYTIEVMLDQPCKFHSVSGMPAAHTTCQCSFTIDLEQGGHQLPGPSPGQPAEAQGNKNRQPAAG